MDETQIKVLLDALEQAGRPVSAEDVRDLCSLAGVPGSVPALRKALEDSNTAMIAARNRNMQSRIEPPTRDWVRNQNVQLLDAQVQRNREILARVLGAEVEPYEPWFEPEP